MELTTKVRKWGSSLAVLLPKALVEETKLRENDQVTIEIKNRPLPGDLFGKFPRKSKLSAQAIKDELRKGWD